MTLNYLEKLRKLEIHCKQKLQDDIDKLVRWSENGRCYSILGNVNVFTQGLETGMNYEMGGTILSETVKEKYLGVTMNANIRTMQNCSI